MDKTWENKKDKKIFSFEISKIKKTFKKSKFLIIYKLTKLKSKTKLGL